MQGIIFFIVNNSIYATYYFLTYKILRKTSNSMRLDKSPHSTWVGRFIAFFLVFYVFKFSLYILNGFRLISSDTYGTFIMLISSFTIQIIAWFMVTNSKWPIFSPADPVGNSELDRLKVKLEKEKLFLDDTLTVNQLASASGMRTERLTEILRLEYHSSFKELINKLRVEEAKQLIAADLNGKPVNLLGIAMDSGFNNKVTFYRAFKKHAGVAPSDYVKQLQSEK